MSQSNILSREQAVYVALESTFGVTPSSTFPNTPTRIITTDEIKGDGATREMLDVSDIRVRRLDAIQPVQGLEIASKVSLKTLLKRTPSASQLVNGASAASIAQRVMLRHVFGSEHAVEGSTIASAASGTSITVAGGDGANFYKGTIIAVEVAGEMEWALVTNVSGDTLTLTPALSGTPTSTAIVRNLYNYAPAESHSSSVAVQCAYVNDANAQFAFNGAYGDVTFDFGEFGKLVTASYDLTAASYTTGALGYSVATGSDDMGRAFALQPQVYLAAASSPTRGTTLVCEKFSVEFKNGWEMVRDPSATQTVNSVVNTAGRPRAAKVMLTLRFDSAYYTGFDAETRYSMAIVQRLDTGTDASFWVWQLNNVKLTATPKLTKVGERLHVDLEFSALQDDAVTVGGTTGAELDFVYAPIRVAFG